MNKRSVLTCIGVMLLLHLESQHLDHVEPPNWWAGMENQHLQIMLHGNGIGHLEATTRHKGVRVVRTTCPENNTNYLFIDLLISPRTKPGVITLSLTEKGISRLQFTYSLLQRESGSFQREGYDATDVIYLITPDRYANGDTTNDQQPEMKEGINRSDKNGRHGGDIEGIRQHLDYISDMGFSALWINPVLENNMDKYSYHGYAATDFYKVDPRMGSNESFKSLTLECEQRGIKMIMDMIHNHCGLNHWWISDPPMADWINYSKKPYAETNHQKTLHPDPYATQEDLTLLEDGWFVPTMPDLNVRNPHLATYLIQNSIWWIEYAGLAGIRMDTYLYPESIYMAEWARRVMEEYPNLTITGEVWMDQPAFLAYWQKGKINADGYQSYLPSLFDFPLHYGMTRALNVTEGYGQGWIQLYEMLANDFQYPDPNQLVVFPDNHDMARIYSQLGENVSRLKMALAYILTIRGIPQIYYGTEILMKSPVYRDDGMIRSDFPGGWPGDPVNAFTGSGLTAQQIDIQQYIKKIVHWRQTATAIHQGQTEHFIPQNGVYVFFRYDHDQKIMIILNKNEQPYTLTLERFRRVLGQAATATEIVTGNQIDLGSSLVLSAPGPMILEINE